MKINFFCACGKRLRAREEMAGRRSMCPRCGAPVGVPARQPTHRGTESAPLSYAERVRRPSRTVTEPALDGPDPKTDLRSLTFPEFRAGSHDAEPEGAATPADARKRQRDRAVASVRLVVGRRAGRALPEPKPRWPFERCWYHCLFYPCRALPQVSALALLLTAVAGGIALLLPGLAELRSASGGFWLAVGSLLAVLASVGGYASAFLELVLMSASAGQGGPVPWPGRQLRLAARSGLRWLACFLAGPVLFAAGGGGYWLYCGDPDPLDWLILAELSFLLVGYWLFALLALCRRDSYWALNPLCVVREFHDFGYRGWAALTGVAVVLPAIGFAAGTALGDVHAGSAAGWLSLAACWTAALFAATFLFRLLGVWAYQGR